MENKNKPKYNIRVYGLVINNKKEVLLTDEYQIDTKMTKFPGGGMEQGEGTIDCLKREFLEEMDQPITNIKHFYTTDYYQPGWFFPDMQVISIYYKVDLIPPLRFRVSLEQFDFNTLENGKQSFRWAAIDQLKPEHFTFPIDRKVLKKLQTETI